MGGGCLEIVKALKLNTSLMNISLTGNENKKYCLKILFL